MRIPPLYVAITWLYDHTGCSILAIIVLHGTVDFAGETLEINRRSEIIFTALWIGFAILLAMSFGARNLGHAVRGPDSGATSRNWRVTRAFFARIRPLRKFEGVPRRVVQ
jgi:hypothetical protein